MRGSLPQQRDSLTDMLCSLREDPTSPRTGSDPAARLLPRTVPARAHGRVSAPQWSLSPRSRASAPRQEPTFPRRRPSPTPAFPTARPPHPLQQELAPASTGLGLRPRRPSPPRSAALAQAAPLSIAPTLTSARRRFRPAAGSHHRAEPGRSAGQSRAAARAAQRVTLPPARRAPSRCARAGGTGARFESPARGDGDRPGLRCEGAGTAAAVWGLAVGTSSLEGGPRSGGWARAGAHLGPGSKPWLLGAGRGPRVWGGYRGPCTPSPPWLVGFTRSPLGAQQKGASFEVPQFIPLPGDWPPKI